MTTRRPRDVAALALAVVPAMPVSAHDAQVRVGYG